MNNKKIEEQSEIQTFQIIKAKRKNIEDLPIKNDTIEPNQIKSDEITNRFQCNFCNKMYSINFHLKQHVRKVHEKTKCVTFSKEYDLNADNDGNHEGENQSKVNHPLLSTQDNIASIGDMSYSYDTCTKRFSDENNLKRHNYVMHKNYKEYKCEPCGKSFSQAGHLKTHINSVHHEQKDKNCDSCGKAFSQAGHLKSHINSVHNG